MKLIEIILAFALCLLVFFFSFSLLIYNINFYDYLFVHSSSSEKAHSTAVLLMDYFRNSSTEPTSFSYFTDAENKHMLDVKIFFNHLIWFFAVILVLFIISLACLNVQKQKVFFYGGLLTIPSCLAIYLLPFNMVFTWVHFSFPAGTWQFPAGSQLIGVFPLQFFMQFASQLLIQAAVIGIALSAIACASRRNGNKVILNTR